MQSFWRRRVAEGVVGRMGGGGESFARIECLWGKSRGGMKKVFCLGRNGLSWDPGRRNSPWVEG